MLCCNNFSHVSASPDSMHITIRFFCSLKTHCTAHQHVMTLISPHCTASFPPSHAHSPYAWPLSLCLETLFYKSCMASGRRCPSDAAHEVPAGTEETQTSAEVASELVPSRRLSQCPSHRRSLRFHLPWWVVVFGYSLGSGWRSILLCVVLASAVAHYLPRRRPGRARAAHTIQPHNFLLFAQIFTGFLSCHP